MPNTNAQAIAFDNTIARPYANEGYLLYLSAKNIVNQWNAQSVSSVIPNDSTVISDGAATDGRPTATNAQVTAMVTRAQEVITDLEANSNAKLNTLLAICTVGVVG